MEKEQNFLVGQIKKLTSEREIAADNGMWLTDPGHFECVLDCQEKD